MELSNHDSAASRNDKPRRAMKIWERHGPLELPFHCVAALLRRCLEEARIVYWRSVFGWEIGKGVRVHWSVKIPRKLQVHLSDRASIGQGVRMIAEYSGGSLRLDKAASIAQLSTLDVTGDLHIGERVTVSEGAILYTHSHGRDPRSPPKGHSLRIDQDVWICARAMVLSSASRIGARAIIGPYVVARSEVQPDQILMTESQVHQHSNHAQAGAG